MTDTTQTTPIKWAEVYSLVALSAAIAVSWIAYHEYQPQLLKNYDFTALAGFLVLAKGLILVLIPPLAGYIADIMIRKTGKLFLIFSVGIGATAMVFMAVASILGIESLIQIKSLLPVLIVLWLITMNIFVSPAISMIDSFAPKEKLPMVMGVIILVTELVYALEPLVVGLVEFFGATLTFIVGAILIGGTGYIFQKVSANEVNERRDQTRAQAGKGTTNKYFTIFLLGLAIGIGRGLLTEHVPNAVEKLSGFNGNGAFVSFALLGVAAIVAFIASRYVSKIGISKIIPGSVIVLLLAGALLMFSSTFTLFITGGIILAIAFSLLSICGIPYAINNLSIGHITLGIGIFIGATEIVSGVLEYAYFSGAL